MFRKLSFYFVATFLFLFAAFSVHANTLNQLMHKPGDPVVGNRNGSITLVEFLDYQCSHCADMHPVVTAIIRKNPQLRVVYKLLPIRGEISTLATQAAIASLKQGKFTSFNNALLASSSSLSEKTIFALAQSSGLNVAKLKADMKSASINNLINQNMQLARDLGLQGTPTFYLGKTGAKNINELNTILGSANERQLQNSINAAGQ